MAGEWGWRLHVQDFSAHRFGQERPKPWFKDYQTRAEADTARMLVAHSDAVVATVTPVPMPGAKKAAATRLRDEASRLFPLPIQTKPHSL